MSWGLVTGNNGLGVQSTGNVTSLSMSFVNAVTSGDFVVVGTSTYLTTSANTCVITDNKGGNSYTNDTGHSTGHFDTEISRSVITNGGTSFQVTMTTANGSYPSICIDEFSLTGALSLDQAIACPASTTSTNAPAVGSLTVTGNDLIYAVLGIDSSTPTVTHGGGFSDGYKAGWVNNQAEGIAAQYQLNVTSNTNPAWSLSGTATTFCCGVAYKTPAATVGTPRFYPIVSQEFPWTYQEQ